MLFFLSTQFIDDGRSFELVSVALVDELGKEYYAANKDWDLKTASPWVVENIIPYLPAFSSDASWKNKAEIKKDILRFIWLRNHSSSENHSYEDLLTWAESRTIEYPEIWSWSNANSIAFFHLFGKIIEFPRGLPRHINILNQTVNELGIPSLPQKISLRQSALDNAKHLRNNYLWLKQNFKHPAFNNYGCNASMTATS